MIPRHLARTARRGEGGFLVGPIAGFSTGLRPHGRERRAAGCCMNSRPEKEGGDAIP